MPGVGGRLLATGVVLATMMTVSSAKAEPSSGLSPRLTVDWGRALEQGMTWLAAQSERKREGTARPAEAPTGSAASTAASSGTLGSAWFGVAPRVSLVARDWGGARSLAGGPMTVTDAIRVSRSSRMVMSRMRLGEGRVVPFTQLGLGQWRVDTDFVPHMARQVELAAQLGAGVELLLTRGWQIAAETGMTVLYREGRDPQAVRNPRMFGTFLASRIEF